MNRIKNIDILRVIGLLCIILAHVEPNNIIFQIRNFDVVLMIMISSYLYIINDKYKGKIDLKYFKKRLKRLLIPTWIFLIIFFIISSVFMKYDLKTIILSFLLHEGIGYVWIIRIYLVVAIMLPILTQFLKEKRYAYIYIMVVYVIYELIAQTKIFNINIFMSDIVAYIVPISLIITVTYWIMNNKSRKIVVFSLVNFLIFIVCFFIIYKLTGKIENTNYMKYPFRIYYLSYAFFTSSILIIICRCKNVINLLHNDLIEFISKSSLWIYLWHILFVILFNNVFKNLNWCIKYVSILFLSIFITYIQNKLIKCLEKNGINKEILNIFKG